MWDKNDFWILHGIYGSTTWASQANWVRQPGLTHLGSRSGLLVSWWICAIWNGSSDAERTHYWLILRVRFPLGMVHFTGVVPIQRLMQQNIAYVSSCGPVGARYTSRAKVVKTKILSLNHCCSESHQPQLLVSDLRGNNFMGHLYKGHSSADHKMQQGKVNRIVLP